MSPWDRRRRRKRNHKRPRMNNRRNSSRDHQNSRSSSHREDQKSSTDRQKSQSSSCRQSDQKSSRDRQKSQSSSRGKDDEKSSHERRCGGGSSRHFSNASNTLSRLSNNSSTKSATKNVRLKLTKRRPIYSHSKKSLQASMETSNADDGDASSSRRRLEKKPHKSMRSTGIFTTRNFGAATTRAGRVPEPSALFDQLKRAVTDDRIRIVRSRIQHIWDRHGCRRNAEFQKILPRNKNKMPSYFNSSDILVNTISSTVQRPNWSRPSPGCGPSKRVGFKVGGMNRFRGGKRNRPSRKKARYNYDNGRTLLFKSFNRPIGVSGVGYGTSLEHDNAECFTCCAVVGTDGTLITAYPILTQEALNRGQGPKTVFDEHPSIITDSDRTHDNVDQKINDRHNEERSREENNEK